MDAVSPRAPRAPAYAGPRRPSPPSGAAAAGVSPRHTCVCSREGWQPLPVETGGLGRETNKKFGAGGPTVRLSCFRQDSCTLGLSSIVIPYMVLSKVGVLQKCQINLAAHKWIVGKTLGATFE